MCSLWGSPDESITECSRVPQFKDENVWLSLHGNAIKGHMCLAYLFMSVIIDSWQGKDRNWAFLIALGNRLIRSSPKRAPISTEIRQSCCLMPQSLVLFWALFVPMSGLLMAVSWWRHRLQCIVNARSFLRLLKLHKIAVRKLDLSRGVLLCVCVRPWINFTGISL